MATMSRACVCLLVLFLGLMDTNFVHGSPNYRDALAKSLLFFQGQRSGRLPSGQKISWRSNSGLSDGSLAHRPEDMDTARTVYWVSPSNPGSDVAAETAAALAAASMVFRKVDPKYAAVLVKTAKKVMQFAMQYRGAYSDSLGSAVCPFYCSYSGYKDELVWGATWLFRATNDVSYYNFLKSIGADDSPDVFSWDNKFAGAHVLLARRALVDNDRNFENFVHEAEDFMCKILPNSPSSSTRYTQGGLMYKMSESNLQYVTSITFLLTTYAKYMKAAKHTFNCNGVNIYPNTLLAVAKKQVDYILGVNPIKMSYMVGFGANYPKRIHHRGSSLPSHASHPQSIGCDGGFQAYYYSANPNPNILTGAIVGGPNENDGYADDRTAYSQSEPATYINGAFVGPVAYFVGSYSR
ncbi:hypothetical protein ACFE04_025531 [Oxalis oulophora]